MEALPFLKAAVRAVHSAGLAQARQALEQDMARTRMPEVESLHPVDLGEQETFRRVIPRCVELISVAEVRL